MNTFTTQAVDTLEKQEVLEKVVSTYSLKELLVVLSYEDTKVSRRNLEEWLRKNQIDISHFCRKAPNQGFARFCKISNEELLLIAKESTSVVQICKKVGVPPKGYYHRSIVLKLRELGFDFTLLTRSTKGLLGALRSSITDDDFFVKGVLRNGSRIKERLLKRGVEDRCSICGQPPIWNSKPLVLQLDHIDGDPSNNVLSNLRILCPHCHTQTETFAGKNKQKRVLEKISPAYKGEFLRPKQKRYKYPCRVCITNQVSSKGGRCKPCSLNRNK